MHSDVQGRESRHVTTTNGNVGWIANYIWGIANDVLRDLYVRGCQGRRETSASRQHRSRPVSTRPWVPAPFRRGA